MHKIFIFLFISGNLVFAFDKAIFSALQEKAKTMQSLIEEGQECTPIVTGNNIKLCTGVEFQSKEAEKIKSLSFSECTMRIESNGYRVLKKYDPKIVTKELWDSFYNTTKRAETIHSPKVVFFKNVASTIECIHELLHTYQWTYKGNEPLAPLNRLAYEEEAIGLLNKAVSDIETLEKSNDKKNLEIYAPIVQDTINTLKEFSALETWLDEKDVHLFIFENCTTLKCKKVDYDIALTNLFYIKNKMQWQLRNKITRLAASEMKEKEQASIKEIKFNPLSKQEKLVPDGLFKMGWDDLISYLKAQKLRLVKYTVDKVDERVLSNFTIPNDIFNKIQTSDKNDLLGFLEYSKIGEGSVLGKYICHPGMIAPVIIVTNQTSKGTLVHEYLHFLQSKKNKEYCIAITGQNEIAQNFQKGKVSREFYEDKILHYKGLIWHTEKEVYETLIGYNKNFSEFENYNNKAQYLLYKARLDKWNILPSFKLADKLRINFYEENDLPFIKVESKHPVVIDTGAMDSTIMPKTFLDYPMDSFTIIKLKTLQNALAQTIEAPIVVVKKVIQVGDNKYSNMKWVLANLRLKNISGVLGLDFFSDSNITIYPKEKYILVEKIEKKPDSALPLQRDFDGSINAIEFICPNNIVVRLDTGSQIEGDISNKLQKDVFDNLTKGKEYKCGNLSIQGRFNSDLQNESIFDRNVSINLGWPWTRKFKKIQVSLNDGWINFE